MTNKLRTLSTVLAILLGQWLLGSAALAGPMTGLYSLSNHPDGSVAPPLYGLRLDGLFGDASQEFTFDFDHAQSDMKLDFDGTSIHIFGTAWGGEDTGSGHTGAELWNIDFTYSVDAFTSFTDINSGAGVKVVNTQDGAASGNTGTISSATRTFNLVDKSSSDDFTFAFAPGHRGVTGLSGWGWLNHCPADGGTGAGSCDDHYVSSDWLFTAEKIPTVPEPGSLILFLLGLLGLERMQRLAPRKVS